MPRVLALLLVLLSSAPTARAVPIDELYRATVIVTGQGEPNRLKGFVQCLGDVLVKVSGDRLLRGDPAVKALEPRAAEFVAGFRYRDRLEGIPIHDEQGTYDRPHDLTCLYKPETVDALLAGLGRRPWVDNRPRIVLVLAVRSQAKDFALSADGADMPYMRDSFLEKAPPLGLEAALPPETAMAAEALTPETIGDLSAERLKALAEAAGGGAAIAGSLVWSDAELGWVGNWHVDAAGREWRWSVRGVSFDDAFRDVLSGAAQILSGNGQPD